MNELKVTFYLKKNEERADGTMPILGRIRIGKSMVQFSTKVYAIPDLWDVKSGRAIGGKADRRNRTCRKTFSSPMRPNACADGVFTSFCRSFPRRYHTRISVTG